MKKAFLLFALLFVAPGLADADFYEDLGVKKDASLSDIKAAYKRLAKKYHPDANQGNRENEDRFIKVQEAYDVLSDAEKRKSYDAYGGKVSSETWHASQGAQQQSRANQAAEIIQAADRTGQKYSNDKWVYDKSTHSFFDKRIGKTLKYHPVFKGQFTSEDGWTFDAHNGKYYLSVFDAELDLEGPENKRFWIRKDGVKISPFTGYPDGITYNPTTVSDSSALFEEMFSPITPKKIGSGVKDGEDLKRRFESLEWTPERKADFIGRAKTHIEIFKNPAMHHHPATTVYKMTFLDVVLKNPKAREFPEIITEYIKDLPNQELGELGKLFVKKEFFEHNNAEIWNRALIRTPAGASGLMWSIVSNDLVASKEKFQKLFPLMMEEGLPARGIHDLISALVSRGGQYGLAAIQEELLYLSHTEEFAKMISTKDSKSLKELDEFFKWYSQFDPESTAVYQKALQMPNTHHGDFYVDGKLDPERGWIAGYLDKPPYEAHLAQTSETRMKFLKENLPARSPVVPAKYKRGTSKALVLYTGCQRQFGAISK